MPDDSQGQSGLQIPDELRQQYPQLIELILGSESMNDEERQYWVNILPIMTPEQVENLRQILENEKQQLEAIDQKYAEEMRKIGKEEQIEETAQKRSKRRQNLRRKEEQYEEKEEEKTEELLRKIEQL